MRNETVFLRQQGRTRIEENALKLLKNHVISHCRNGRPHYDPQVKQALIHYAAMSNASIHALARKHGVKAGQLRR